MFIYIKDYDSNIRFCGPPFLIRIPLAVRSGKKMAKCKRRGRLSPKKADVMIDFGDWGFWPGGEVSIIRLLLCQRSGLGEVMGNEYCFLRAKGS